MRKIVAALVVLLMLPLGAAFSQDAEASYSVVTMAAGVADDEFDDMAAGFMIGSILPVDKDKGMFLRTAMNQVNWPKDSPLRAIEVSSLWYWYLGKKWNFWWTAGAQAFVSGTNDGTHLLTGLGCSRKVYNWPDHDGLGIHAFGEIQFVDAGDEPTGKLLQANIGLVWDRP